jgi:hypothetical protein
MAEIVNLRPARKRKRRNDKERIADENRRSHGRSVVDKTATRLAKNLDDKRLDSHRREPPDGGQPS